MTVQGKKVALQHHAKHLEIFGAHSSWIMYATLALVFILFFYFFIFIFIFYL